MDHLPLIKHRVWFEKEQERLWWSVGRQIVDYGEDDYNEYWNDMRQMRSVGLVLLCGGGVVPSWGSK